jgi:hypothetical protein
MFNDTIAGKTFLRDPLKHSRSFPARLKAEDLLRRSGNETIRIEKMIPKKRSCSAPLSAFNAMVFSRNAPRYDGLRKGFLKKSLLWLKNKAP